MDPEGLATVRRAAPLLAGHRRTEEAGVLESARPALGLARRFYPEALVYLCLREPDGLSVVLRLGRGGSTLELDVAGRRVKGRHLWLSSPASTDTALRLSTFLEELENLKPSSVKA